MTDLQILMTVEEAANALRIGRTRMFALIASGEIASVLIGRSRRISVDALREYTRRLPQNAA
jgi:excisionase family DNA binding protein